LGEITPGDLPVAKIGEKMDLGRFHRAIHLLTETYKSATPLSQIDQLINDLNVLAGNPSSPDAATTFRDRLETLRQSLEEFSIETKTGSTQEIISELKLNQYVGDGLFENIKTTMTENQLSPALAAQALSTLRTKLEKNFNHIAAIDSAFSVLGVEYENLEYGETEISLKLPTQRDEKTLSDLALEAKEWNQIIATLSEVFDPTRPQSKIRTLASGSWLIYLSSTPLVLWGIALTLRRVNQILSETIKTRELIAQLIAVSAPTKELENHQEKKLKIDLESLAKTLVKTHYKGNDSGRKNELIGATSIALKQLSKKIASGAKINFQIESQEKPAIVDEAAPTAEEKEQIRAVEQFEELKGKIESEISQIEYLEDPSSVLALLPAPSEEDPSK
jgi:hypothetical protein